MNKESGHHLKQQKKKNKVKILIRLVVNKSFDEPWPSDFIGRSKWDLINLLKPWKNYDGQGDLKMHMETQFD